MSSLFENLLPQCKAILESKLNTQERLEQICQLLRREIDHYDWVGIYWLDGDILRLGPFDGKPTEHIAIPVGNGVCGEVAKTAKSKIVQDVSQELNYIACSLDVQSEIVVPILKNGKFVAEIDIDSHASAPFTSADEQFLLQLGELISPLF